MNQPVAETIFWIAAVACVIAQIAILRSTYAAQRVEKSDLVPSASRGGGVVTSQGGPMSDFASRNANLPKSRLAIAGVDKTGHDGERGDH